MVQVPISMCRQRQKGALYVFKYLGAYNLCDFPKQHDLHSRGTLFEIGTLQCLKACFTAVKREFPNL